jgi:hypothetical protein
VCGFCWYVVVVVVLRGGCGDKGGIKLINVSSSWSRLGVGMGT